LNAEREACIGFGELIEMHDRRDGPSGEEHLWVIA